MATKKGSSPQVVADAVIVNENKFSLVPTPLEQSQVLRLFSRTPKSYIKKRPAKGGGEWEYVSGAYVQKVLNYVFGFLWNFEIVHEEVQGDQITVRGRLTINRMKDGGDIVQLFVKEQYGRADIKYKKDSKFMLDYGNDKKAAATDALKKCASMLGIASDIYAKEEFRDIKVDEAPPTPQVEVLDERQIAALDSLKIDRTNIKTKEQAVEAIKMATKKKASQK